MKCSTCSFENEKGVKICANCGTELKKKGLNKALFIIPVVVILLVVVLFAIRIVLSSPKMIYSSMIKKLGNSINEKSRDYKAYYNVTLKPTVSKAGQKELEKLLNKVTIVVGANYNIKNKEIVFGLNTKYNNKNLVSIDMNYKNQNAYLFLNKLLDYPIKVDAKSLNLDDNSIDEKNTNKMVNGFTNALSKSIKSDYITKSKKTLAVNNKEIKLNAYTLTINEKNYKEITSSIKKELLNDKEFIKAYSKVTNKTEKEVKKYIKETLDADDFDKDIKIVLYTSGLFNNKFVAINIIYDDTSFEVINNKEDDYDVIIKESKVYVELNIDIKKTNKKIDINSIKNAKDVNELEQKDILNILDNIKKMDAYSDLNKDSKDALGTDLDSLIDYAELYLSYSNELTIE